MSRDLGAVLLLAVIVAAASGCGGASSATLPDACTLVSPSEVESLLGQPTTGVLERTTTAGGELSRCSWKRTYSPELRTDELVLSVAPAAAYPAAGSSSALVGASTYAIGDEGRLLDQSRGVQAQWKKGSLSASYRYGVTGAFTGDFEVLRARAKELAQAANGRM